MTDFDDEGPSLFEMLRIDAYEKKRVMRLERMVAKNRVMKGVE